VALEGRRCAHPACGGEACATRTYEYAGRTAWIDDLSVVASPAGYDLCTAHARAFSVPQGWTRSDRRAAAGPARADDDASVAAPS
jgi:hypothetical protein